MGYGGKEISVTPRESLLRCINGKCLCYVFISSTLVIGGAGSLMLDLYSWESVFYVSGLLSVLWAYCMWKYLLKGEGGCADSCW